MELATVKSMVIQDDALDEVVSHPEYKSYDVLARHGYKPARKVAPIANGYPMIDVSNIYETLQQLGHEVPKDVQGNIAEWERVHRREEYSGYSPDYNTRKFPDDWCIVKCIRANPSTHAPTRISIRSSKLAAYNKLIPPDAAKKIAVALESELFDEVAIWYPQEFEYPKEAVQFDLTQWRTEQSQRMLQDPIAVGMVVTTGRGGYDINTNYFYIDFWPQDVALGEKAKWLLTEN